MPSAETMIPYYWNQLCNTTCSKSWDNTIIFETDIGKKSFSSMAGTTYKVQTNATYGYAYAIMNKIHGLIKLNINLVVENLILPIVPTA